MSGFGKNTEMYLGNSDIVSRIEDMSNLKRIKDIWMAKDDIRY